MDNVGVNEFKVYRRMHTLSWCAVPGAFAETHPRYLANTTGSFNTGLVYVTACMLAPYDTVSKISMWVQATGTITHSWWGLADPFTKTVLATTADNTSPFTVNVYNTFSLTTPWTNNQPAFKPIWLLSCITFTVSPIIKASSGPLTTAVQITPLVTGTFTGSPTPLAVGTTLSGQGTSSSYRYFALS